MTTFHYNRPCIIYNFKKVLSLLKIPLFPTTQSKLEALSCHMPTPCPLCIITLIHCGPQKKKNYKLRFLAKWLSGLAPSKEGIKSHTKKKPFTFSNKKFKAGWAEIKTAMLGRGGERGWLGGKSTETKDSRTDDGSQEEEEKTRAAWHIQLHLFWEQTPKATRAAK